MLEADSVTLYYGEQKILSGCYLSCKKGEIVGLLGRNGSGKSSLLKVIFGALNPHFMHLRIAGKISKKGYRNKVAYLPQDPLLPPFLSVESVISQLDNSLIPVEVSQLVTDLKTQKVSSLSAGESKILECLWILSGPADYILLDEPFSGLSPIYVDLVQELILRASATKGIILTDHLYRSLLKISTRIVLLHNKAIYQIQHESDLIRYNYIPDFL